MGIILIPIFLLNIVFVIFVCIHIFTMQTLNPASWQNAMLWGCGISLLFCLPTLLIKSSKTGAEAAQDAGQNLMNIMGGAIAFPAILVFLMSFFPKSWHWFHFIEGILGAISVCSLTILTVGFALPVIFAPLIPKR